jgi:hypothetical protein
MDRLFPRMARVMTVARACALLPNYLEGVWK